MKIEMEFQGLKELMKAFEDAASDEDIKGVNQKIVKQSEPVVKNIMSGKIPKSADIKLSGRGFGSKSSVTSHAADSIPLGAVKVKDTGASADVGWEKSDNSEHFYVKFINWGTIYRPPQTLVGCIAFDDISGALEILQEIGITGAMFDELKEIIEEMRKGVPLGYFTSQWFGNFYFC